MAPGGDALDDLPRLRGDLERMRASVAFLSEANRVLYESLDHDKTLAALARMSVPMLGDQAIVDLLEPDGRTRRVAVAPLDPERETDPEVVRAVLLSGQPILQDRASMCVPLRARGHTLGAISLAAAASGRSFDETDLRLAVEIGIRAGIAVDNARLYRDAQEAVRVRDDFLAVAGHELRTPLTALKLQLQGLERLVERGAAAARPEEIPARLGRASAHVERLSKLVNDLLDVSRIAAGRLELEPEDGVDLAEIIREVAARFDEDLDEMGSRLTLELPAHLLGRWDAARLDHMIANLLANAIKYGAGRPILLRATSDGRRARLLVRDEGIGIEHEEQLRIFGRFERAVSARRYSGFGLGLWIVHRIVEMSGGTIVLESDPGQGATFLIELPTGG